MGLGKAKAREIFYFREKSTGSSSRADLNYPSEKAEAIACDIDSLDHFCTMEQISSINLIKCDVEGSALFVFRGGVETLRKYRPYVLCEMLRKWAAKYDYHPNEIIKLFASMGYLCVALRRETLGAGYIMNQMTETTTETNFLFVPKERSNAVRTFLSFL